MDARKAEAEHSSAKSVTFKNSRRSDAEPSNPISGSKAELPLQVREVAFAELGDGTLVEVIEDPDDPRRTRFAIAKRGRVRFADWVKLNGEVLVPISRSAVGFSDVKLPTGVRPYGSVTNLAAWTYYFLKCSLDVSDLSCFVLAAFVLYSWLADRLLPAVYLSIVGLPQSGKSTLLELLSTICRQPLFVTDISAAAVYQACRQFSPTLLIDEVEWHSSKGSGSLRQQMRAGTGRSSHSLRVRGSASSFGPKVFSSLEPSTDPALNSRCLQIIMTETLKRGLLKPGHPSMLACASDLRQRLLKFRFNRYGSIRPATFPGLEELRPRSRDLFACLSAPMARSKILSRYLLDFIRDHHDPTTREALGTGMDAMLTVVFEFLHQFPSSSVRVKVLAQLANSFLRSRNERLVLNDKLAGTTLSSLGFRSRKRTNQGWVLMLDSETEKRAHQLFRTHGITHLLQSDLERYAKSCPICKTFLGPPNS
jgi:hypothetical protein